jgi:alanyl-tRNA synthetase
MTATELRQRYLDFFKARQHALISSASLLPENDATLLFTNSGMSPLVPYLLGDRHPAGQRLVNSQKCFRAEDIEEVGDSRHNTFFEMLGNWSLGDYFKAEQLAWWLEFIIEDLRLDPTRIYQTVYAGSADGQIKKDQETIVSLQEIFEKYGLEAAEGPETLGAGSAGPGQALDFKRQRIFAYRDKNWWQRGEAVGELGGPDSETFYDTGRSHDHRYGTYCHVNCDCGRFLEIGNSVFMQYQRVASGWQSLANKNVDFGGGLERILMIVNGQDSIFKTDLFSRVIDRLTGLSGQTYVGNQRAFEIIADHLKAATFLLADDKQIRPANTDQGYIIRRLLRRALRYGRQLNIGQNFWLKEIAAVVIEDYQSVYPELSRNQTAVFAELDKEEEKFVRTLELGLREINRIFQRYKNQAASQPLGAACISGEEAFRLYQSYGFPIEMTEEFARENQCDIDKLGFYEELTKHQDLSRTAAAGKFKGGLADAGEQTTKLHTAAHLLLAALRQVLGNHVFQKGSNITAERLRLDFSHPDKINPEQLQAIEKIVNQAIQADFPVTCEELSLEEAKRRGAMGVFDSKYEEKVNVYTVGRQLDSPANPVALEASDGDQVFSREICGGPHVKNTGVLGHFKIQKEESSSAGVRRIKAVLEA